MAKIYIGSWCTTAVLTKALQLKPIHCEQSRYLIWKFELVFRHGNTIVQVDGSILVCIGAALQSDSYWFGQLARPPPSVAW